MAWLSGLRAKAGFEKQLDRRKLAPFDPSRETYQRRSQAHELSYDLCSECICIDFLNIFCVDSLTSTSTRPGGWRGDIAITLSDAQQRSNIDCPLCQLFQTYARSSDLKNDRQWLLRVEYQRGRKCRSGRNAVFLTLTDGSPSSCCIAPTKWKVAQPTRLPNLTPKSEYLESNSILYSMLSSEIRNCAATDAQSFIAATSNAYIDHMVMFDCRERKVVAYDGKSDYLTLSYVWGDHSRAQVRSNPQGRFAMGSLPRTIEDAILVTLNFGKTYLWIDRYCVDQVNPDRMKSQINDMSHVFRHSWATIVSLGADDQTPLPGVTADRPKLRLVETPQCDLLAPGIATNTLVKNSVWNTRAWTFQEAVLSMRLLLFAESEVHLMCKHGTVLESIDGLGHIPPKKRRFGKVTFERSTMYGPQFLSSTMFSIFGHDGGESALQEYCSRDLTLEDDSINAFRGYLQDSGSGSSALSYWGVLIAAPGKFDHRSIDLPTAYEGLGPGICWGLLWHKENGVSVPTVRTTTTQSTTMQVSCSQKFPSWSWASCRPNVKMAGQGRFMQRTFLSAAAFLDVPDGRILPLLEVLYLLESSRKPGCELVIPESHPYIWLQGRVLDSCSPATIEDLLSRWEIKTDLHGITLKSQFLPDVRTCCPLHMQWEADQTVDAALLVLIETNTVGINARYIGTAYWLALRYIRSTRNAHIDDDGYWHRIGLIKAFFSVNDVEQCLTTQELKDCHGDVHAIGERIQKVVKRILQNDMDVQGHVRILKLG